MASAFHVKIRGICVIRVARTCGRVGSAGDTGFRSRTRARWAIAKLVRAQLFLQVEVYEKKEKKDRVRRRVVSMARILRLTLCELYDIMADKKLFKYINMPIKSIKWHELGIDALLKSKFVLHRILKKHLLGTGLHSQIHRYWDLFYQNSCFYQ